MEEKKTVLEEKEIDGVSGGFAVDTLEYRKGRDDGSTQTLELRKAPECCPRCGSRKLESEILTGGTLLVCKVCGEKILVRPAAEVVLL
ncbi:MAG: hypothetical protein IJH53_02880 [Oscillospiraceae bacterium]|nr:hypothetical protein [Oscillospiraceae bacterium]